MIIKRKYHQSLSYFVTIEKVLLDGIKVFFKRGPLYFREGLKSSQLESTLYPVLKPSHSEQACDSCEKCVEICPTNALSLGEKIDKNLPPTELKLYLKKCIFCQDCISACPLQVLAMEEIEAQAFHFEQEAVLDLVNLALTK